MLQDISKEVWNQNYRATNEKNHTDTWDRQARAAASVEDPKIRETIYQQFLWLLTDFKAMAGGRITANLGVEGREGTTLMNCFVINPRDIKYEDPDSIRGIYDMLKDQALTLKSEGGYGMNFSWLRPNGMYVRGIASRTPGVVEIMSLWNQSSAVITMGSDEILGDVRPDEKKKIRKGAQMGILEIWHPEIEKFIDAKLVEGRLNKFNLSIGITEGFMQAVEEDKKWELKFPDTECDEYKTQWFGNIKEWEDKKLPVKIYKRIPARDLWDKIMKATYTRNDPGVLFLDIANKLNPLAYAEDIATTNPCVTGDTIVAVADGNGDRTIKQLADEGLDVPVYCIDNNDNVVIRTMRNPRITGEKEVFELTLENGHKVKATANHKFLTTTGEYKEVKDLNVGDGLSIMHKTEASIQDLVQKKNTNTKKYQWVKFGSKVESEHRMIYSFENDIQIPKGYVIHHKDYNTSNNHISNLEMIKKPDHDKLHGKDMMGDRNPMISWYKDATDEEKRRYHDNMSNSVFGERNGNFSGVSNAELLEHAIKLTKKNGRIFTSREWVDYAKDNKLPQFFSGWRKNHLGGINGLAKKAAKQLGILPPIEASGKILQVYYQAIDQGYDAEIVDNHVIINKICEVCGSKFSISYKHREQGVCSRGCGFKNYVNDKHIEIKKHQIDIFNKLKFQFKRDPKKCEWVNICKEEGISYEISRKSSPFKNWNTLKEEASELNHRIISIERTGTEIVYNGTVDDYHNFFIGGFKEMHKSLKFNDLVYINNRNCGEISMSTGVCNLMSLNLVKYMITDKDGNRFFDYDTFRKAVAFAVRFSDNINDISRAPLEAYKASMTEKRRIGIGVLGLGSLHYMMGIRFGSDKSKDLIRDIFRCKTEAEILTSANLGKEKGSFSQFDAEKYFNTYWWKTLDVSDEFKSEIEKIGAMRNSHRSANAPTGNMSIYAGVVSGGIEPVFMREYTRWSIVPEKDRSKLKAKGLTFPEATQGEWFETDVFKVAKRGTDNILRGSFEGVDYQIDKNRGLVKASQVVDYGWDYVKENFTEDEIKEMELNGVFATTVDLTVDDHVKTLEIIAKYVDMSSSKTVNIPNDYPFEKFKTIYMDAWKAGIKGITTYRDGTMAAVLEKKQEIVEKRKELENIFTNAKNDVIINDVKLPDEYYSKGVVIRDHNRKKWYVTMAFADSAMTRPFAIFVNTNSKESNEVAEETIHTMMKLAKTLGIKKSLIDDQLDKYQGQSNVTKIARSIGFLLRHNVQIINIVDVLDEGNYPLSSFTFHIKRLLKQYIKDGTEVEGKNNKCPKCGGAMIFNEGCILCRDCAYSKCS